jgi:hypothetical protein
MSDQNQLTEVKQADIIPGFGSLQSFELAQRTANLLAKSSLVPKEYQGNIPNCVIALNMANRMNADPLMVMQNLYIVYGRPGWSSLFLISTFNTSGRFSALRYEWTGKPGTDSYGCKAWAVEKATGEKLEGSIVTIGMAKQEGWYDKNGSKWKTMPQQMLMYRAASWFVRAYAPELAMGMHTEYEIMDAHDAPEERVQQEIDRNANTTVIDIQPEDITPVLEEKPSQDKPVAELEKENNKKGTDSKQADQPEQVTMTGPTF